MKYLISVLCAFVWFTAPALAQVAGITPCAAESLSVTGSTGNVALSGCGAVAIVYNITSQEAFYNLGTSSVTATTSNYSIPGNAFVVLQVSTSPSQFLAAITASSTTTLRVVQGWAQP